jgi:hypothetical protein
MSVTTDLGFLATNGTNAELIPLPPCVTVGGPVTNAIRCALQDAGDSAATADLLFFERWELAPRHGAATALRIMQIRRANPALADAVRVELAASARGRHRDGVATTGHDSGPGRRRRLIEKSV